MSKRARQYIGVLSAVAACYILHEGARLQYALPVGVFRRINFMDSERRSTFFERA